MTETRQLNPQGATICQFCKGVFPGESALEICPNCGARLEMPKREEDIKRVEGGIVSALAEMADDMVTDMDIVNTDGAKSMKERIKGAITCCWCGKRYPERGDRVNCDNCDGNLPMPAADDPGPRPDHEPRTLPKEFLHRLLMQQLVNHKVALSMLVVPIVLSFVSPWFYVLLLVSPIGLFMLIANTLEIFKRYKLLKNWKAIPGRIEKILAVGELNEKNLRLAEKGKAHNDMMFRMSFLMQIDGETVRGVHYTHTPSAREYFRGQPVWIIYSKHKKDFQSLWPPV